MQPRVEHHNSSSPCVLMIAFDILISLWLSPRYVPSVSHSTLLSSCKRRSDNNILSGADLEKKIGGAPGGALEKILLINFMIIMLIFCTFAPRQC